jgi:hypothetical protein
MLQSWRRARVLTYAGYILGFPNDAPDSIRRDIHIIQRELPIDILEFFVLTPLPGSKDHQDLYRKRAWMESDLSKYDTEHVTTGHPRMTTQEWESIYREAWHLYYSPTHIQTLIRRAKASGISTSRILTMILHFYASFAFEGVHPSATGRNVATENSHSTPALLPAREPGRFLCPENSRLFRYLLSRPALPAEIEGLEAANREGARFARVLGF